MISGEVVELLLGPTGTLVERVELTSVVGDCAAPLDEGEASLLGDCGAPLEEGEIPTGD